MSFAVRHFAMDVSKQPVIIWFEHIRCGAMAIAKICILFENGIFPEFWCHCRQIQ